MASGWPNLLNQELRRRGKKAVEAARIARARIDDAHEAVRRQGWKVGQYNPPAGAQGVLREQAIGAVRDAPACRLYVAISQLFDSLCNPWKPPTSLRFLCVLRVSTLSLLCHFAAELFNLELLDLPACYRFLCLHVEGSESRRVSQFHWRNGGTHCRGEAS